MKSLLAACLALALLAGPAGAFVAMMVTWFKDGKPDVAMTGNGLLAGLVGVTAGCWAVDQLGALLIGTVAGVLVVFSVIFFDRIRIDDPVGASSVHGVCGAWGTIAVGLFSELDGEESGGLLKEGLFYGQCSELCGKDHAFMPIAIRVVSEAQYDTWLAAARTDLDGANKALMAEIEAVARVASAAE